MQGFSRVNFCCRLRWPWRARLHARACRACSAIAGHGIGHGLDGGCGLTKGLLRRLQPWLQHPRPGILKVDRGGRCERLRIHGDGEQLEGFQRSQAVVRTAPARLLR